VTFVNCFSKSINPISRLPSTGCHLELCDNWQLIAKAGLVTSPGQQQISNCPSSALSMLLLLLLFCCCCYRCCFCLFRIFAQAPAVRLGSPQFQPVKIEVEVEAEAEVEVDDWWRKCNRHWLHVAKSRSHNWTQICTAKRWSIPDVKPWGCWRLTVSLIGRFLL